MPENHAVAATRPGGADRLTVFASAWWPIFLVALLLSAPRAGATVYVPMSDSELADQAPVIAVVTVEEIASAPSSRAIATDYLVQVDRVLKGDVPGSRIVLRVPGGVRADGVGLKIWGAPVFQVKESAIVFLHPNDDGSYGIHGLMLGAFHLRAEGDGGLALRDLSEAHAVAFAAAGTAEDHEPLRDRDLFTAWLTDRAAGIDRPADYRQTRAGVRQVTDTFTQLTASDGKSPRWFDFESRSVKWYMYVSGQPGLSAADTAASFAAALAAWTSDPTSSISYAYAGTTPSKGGLKGPDNISALLFDDPNGDIAGSFNCAGGGIVAMSGPFFYVPLREYRGVPYHETFEANIVTNDGTQCFFQDNPKGAEEIFAHELGHTLGFGHSSEKNALMFAKAHNDGRGSRLQTDERVGASKIYGDGSYQPPPPPPPPAAAIQASGFATSKTTVRLAWTHNLDHPTSFDIEVQQPNGSFKILAARPSGVRFFVVKSLLANHAYVFRVSGHVAGQTKRIESNTVKVRTMK